MPPKVAVQIPPFDGRQPDKSAFDVCGMRLAAAGERAIWESRQEPSGNAIYASIANFPYIDRVDRIDNFGGRILAQLDNGHAPLDIRSGPNGNIVATSATAPTQVDGRYLAFAFDGAPYILATVSREIRSSTATPGTAWSPLTQNNSLADAMTAAGVAEEIDAVEVWQNRVWVVAGNAVFWSAVDSVSEWRGVRVDSTDENLFITTSAGFQGFAHEREVRGLARHNDRLVIFGERHIYSAQATGDGLIYRFTPFSTGVRYVGGAVSTRRGLMFRAEDGFWMLTGDGSLERASEPVEGRLSEIVSDWGAVTSIVVDDTAWFFGTRTQYAYAYDLQYGTGTIGVCGTDGFKIAGAIDRSPTNLDSDIEIGSTDLTLDDLDPLYSGIRPAALVFDSASVGADAGSVDIVGWAPPDRPHIQFRTEISPGSRRVFLQEAAVRVSGHDWGMRVRDRSGSFGRDRFPGPDGSIRFGGMPFTVLDCEVFFPDFSGTERLSVELVDIETTGGAR